MDVTLGIGKLFIKNYFRKSPFMNTENSAFCKNSCIFIFIHPVKEMYINDPVLI